MAPVPSFVLARVAIDRPSVSESADSGCSSLGSTRSTRSTASHSPSFSAGQKDVGSPLSFSKGRKDISSLKNAASYNLRSFSKRRGTLRQDPTEVAKAIQQSPRPLNQVFVDLEGKNGGWRRRRAQEELLAYREQDQQEKLTAQRRQTLHALQSTKLEEQHEHEKIEQLRLLELQEEKDCQRQLLEEQEQTDRLRKQRRLENIAALNKPRVCSTCNGLKTCTMCKGIGYREALYLTPRITNERFYGRTFYGCQTCGGVTNGDVESGKQKVSKGTGQCCCCNGTGETWPTPDEIDALIQQELDGWR